MTYPEPTRRPWYRRSKVMVPLVVAVSFVSWGVYVGIQGNRIATSIRDLESRGVYFKREAAGPNWLVSFVGFWYEPYVNRVVEAGIYGANVTDDDLIQLSQLDTLRNIEFRWVGDGGGTSSFPRITDKGLACLASMSNLRNLKIISVNLTDRSIESLAAIGRLKHLELWWFSNSAGGHMLTDASIPHFQKMTSLSTLVILSLDASRDWTTKLKEALPNVRVNVSRR